MLDECRAPPGAEAANFSVGPPAGDSEAAAAAWDAYWGFDCVAQRGLCDAMYSHLGIAQSSWQALKMLPAVSTPRMAHSRGNGRIMATPPSSSPSIVKGIGMEQCSRRRLQPSAVQGLTA